jgi:hypothetical protein
MVVLSTWTTLFALATELEARTYGGGILKVEPATAQRLLVVGDGTADVAELDARIRERGKADAMTWADELVLRGHIGLSAREVKLLRRALQDIQTRRGVQ